MLGNGTRLAQYRLEEKIGAGGMGEVWRAVDTTLDRAVALKILPDALSHDAQRLARFDREARLLASLNHPNIAVIHGLHSAEGVHFLAMELVGGENLADRLGRGPVPVDEAIAVALQVTEALEAAHDSGIVHRDLKPANIQVTPEGKVKVLDFGLAKAMSAESGFASAASLANSPTLTTAGATIEGVILGTAAYMSPEQAKGKAVDKRADIWAFGVVLYEMLVGRKLFEAETLPETLGAIFRQEIDLGALPPTTPARLRRLVERCLERDPKRRLRDIGEARIALDAIAAGDVEAPPATATAGRRGVPLPIVAAALVSAVAIAAVVAGRRATPSSAPAPASTEVTEFSIGVDGLVRMDLSPDGRRLSWVTRGGATLGDAPWTESGKGDLVRRLWVRDFDDRVPREVASDADLRTTFWSPDGSQFAAVLGERLWRIPAAGGERTPICDLPTIEGVSGRGVLSGVWLPDDTLLFAAWRGGIYRVPARGGDPEIHIPIDPKVDVDFHQILLLPDGKSLVLAVHRQRDESDVKAPKGRIEIVRDGRREVLAVSEELADLVPLGYSDGTLVVASSESNDTSAWGVPFDATRAVVTGRKFVLIPRVSEVATAADGTLAYVAPRESPSVVTRVDRAGTEIARFGEPHPHLDRQALSPDGSRLAVVLDTRELWVRDLRRGTLTRLATEEDFVEDPQWTPDGRTIYYAAGNSSRIRRIRADPGATPETVLDDAYRAFLTPDGSGILMRKGGFRLEEAQGIYWAPLDSQGRPGEPRKILGGLDSLGRLAPGGRLLAYAEGISGKREAFLTTFPAADQTIQLSASGGGTPQWSADGEAVYYLSGNALIEVRVGLDAAGRLTASPERTLFDLDKVGLRPDGWSTAPDGNGFLLLKSLAVDNRSEIVVVRNGLRRAKPPTR